MLPINILIAILLAGGLIFAGVKIHSNDVQRKTNLQQNIDKAKVINNIKHLETLVKYKPLARKALRDCRKRWAANDNKFAYRMAGDSYDKLFCYTSSDNVIEGILSDYEEYPELIVKQLNTFKPYDVTSLQLAFDDFKAIYNKLLEFKSQDYTDFSLKYKAFIAEKRLLFSNHVVLLVDKLEIGSGDWLESDLMAYLIANRTDKTSDIEKRIEERITSMAVS